MDSAATTTPVSHTESPAELRARAAHARRRARTLIFYEVEPKLLAFAAGLIPMPADQNLCAQSRSPMDMIVHG